MVKNIISLCIAIACLLDVKAQTKFPQQKINDALAPVNAKKLNHAYKPANAAKGYGAFNVIDKFNNFRVPTVTAQHTIQSSVTDTLIVGLVPNDTLIITGTWNHDGPIWVFSDGVLIFDNATVTNTNGDLIVWQSGKVVADSSSFFFPQQYFYERSFIAVQNAELHFSNCNFNFSGVSHNLVLTDSVHATFNNIHHNDWTTCGMFGSPTLNINGCNLSGEYILQGKSQTTFVNADTLLLWHYFADSAVVNYSFPASDTVYNYHFNDGIAGVDGVAYNVFADSCVGVMWALMPVNGSDVTISNSTIRAIGNWFERGDTAIVYGIFNNSNYTNYQVPLADRTQHLINSYVQTWSMYVFDSSQIVIDSCQLGEVGTQQQASVISQDFLLDGSGGYFWATDSSGIIASNVVVYTTVRSEKKGFFVLAYSLHPFTAPSAIGESTLICAQNLLGADPIPYSSSTAWLQVITQPDTVNSNTVALITGSAWINSGPLGSNMSFGSYSLSYASLATGLWQPLVVDSLVEISNATLAQLNTQGLATGDYIFRLTVKNNLGDSVESYKPFYVKQFVGINELSSLTDFTVSPNPNNGILNIQFQSPIHTETIIEIKNTKGELLLSQTLGSRLKLKEYSLDIGNFAQGVYLLEVKSDGKLSHKKIVKL